MAAQLAVTNISGSSVTIPDGPLAAGATRNLSLDLILKTGYYQTNLANLITAGSITVSYNNVNLTAAQMIDIEISISVLERATTDPELDRLDVVGGATVKAAGGDIKLVGRNLLQSQTFDHIQLTEALGGTLDIYTLAPGDSGITVEVTVGLGGLVLTYAAKKLTIELAAAGSSDDAVATAINANGSVVDGILRAVSGTTGNFTIAQATAPLTGGTGNWDDNQIFCGGLAALPANQAGINATAKWSDTGITCTTQAVGAATDVVNIVVRSNGIWTQALSAELA